MNDLVDTSSALLTKSEHGTTPNYSSIHDNGGNNHLVDQITDINSEVILIQNSPTKVYKRRWYVLMVFSLFTACQYLVWNTWGPISDSAKDAFGWTDFDIALLSNWGPILIMITSVFFSWLLQVKGARISCLVSCFSIVVGTGIRCISTTPPLSTWMMHLGQILNGVAGAIAMSASSVISSTWFPPTERTTATAIGVLIPDVIGLAGSFLIGPLLVPHFEFDNNSYLHNISDSMPTHRDNHTFLGRVERERHDIQFLLYVEFGIVGSVFLVMLLYFPNKPPLPPCISASLNRQEFFSGYKELIRCKKFWLVAVGYGTSIGISNTWAGIINLVLQPLGISQTEAGWIGFYSSAGACGASLVISRIADNFSKHLKWFILLLYVVGFGFTLWLCLACSRIVSYTTAVFYITIIMSVLALNSAVPLLFEMACELAYPIGESTTNGILIFMNNLGGAIFLFILMVPNIGTSWMNWSLLGSIVLCLPLYSLIQEDYKRLKLDESRSHDITSTAVLPGIQNNTS